MQDGGEVTRDDGQPTTGPTAEPTAGPTAGPTTGPTTGPGKGPVSAALPASGKKPAPKKGEEKKGDDKKKQDFKAAEVANSGDNWANKMQGLIYDHILGDGGIIAGMGALKDAIKNKMDENKDQQAKGPPDKAQAPGKDQVVVKTQAASASPPPPANNAGGSATPVGNSAAPASAQTPAANPSEGADGDHVDTASPPPADNVGNGVTADDDATASASVHSSPAETEDEDELEVNEDATAGGPQMSIPASSPETPDPMMQMVASSSELDNAVVPQNSTSAPTPSTPTVEPDVDPSDTPSFSA